MPVSPAWRPWEEASAARELHGKEITVHRPAKVTGTSTSRADFPAHSLDGFTYSKPAAARAERVPQATSTSTHRSDYHRHPGDHRRDTVLMSLPTSPNVPPDPAVAYHTSDRASRKPADALIERRERQAWERGAKTLPVRALYHGEDEGRAASADKGARAPVLGGTRGHAPSARQPPGWTRGGTGSSYAAPRTDRVTSQPWRQHGARRPRPASASAEPPPPPRRNRASDFGGEGAGWLFDQDSAEATNAAAASAAHRQTKEAAARVGIRPTAEWRRELRERARSALPGGPTAVAGAALAVHPERMRPAEHAWRSLPRRCSEANRSATKRPSAWAVRELANRFGAR